MALVLNGSGITSANIVDGTIVDEDVADVAASKLTGALPAIDGSALTGLPAAGNEIGDGQTWQNMISSRAFNTTYTNTTGRSIFVFIAQGGTAIVNGIAVTDMDGYQNFSYVVPNGVTYKATGQNYLNNWLELR